MIMNTFIAGYHSSSYLYNKATNKEDLNGNLAKQINQWNLNNQTVTIDEYKLNIDNIKKAAIDRALFSSHSSSPIKLTRNSDSTISYEYEHSPFDRDKALEEVRKSGLSKEINWKTLSIELNNNTITNSNNFDRIEHSIDYYASEYAYYKNRIESDFTGEKLQAELKNLDELFNSKIGSLAENFTEVVGGYFSKNGVTTENDNIKNSILDIYNKRKDQYIDFIDKNDNYSGVKGTEDEWLVRDREFMGEQLRFSVASSNYELSKTSKGGYTVDDLSAAATLARETWNISYSGSYASEEELGVELGVAAMKYQLISKQDNISDKMREKLELSFKNFINNKIEEANQGLKELRESPYTKDKHKYGDLNKKAIEDIINNMLDNLYSNDINAAFRSDIKTALKMYKSKFINIETRELGRYSSDYGALSYLEKTKGYKSGDLSGFNSSQIKDIYFSAMRSNLATDWNRFVKRLSPSEGADRYLLEDKLYILNTNA